MGYLRLDSKFPKKFYFHLWYAFTTLHIYMLVCIWHMHNVDVYVLYAVDTEPCIGAV